MFHLEHLNKKIDQDLAVEGCAHAENAMAFEKASDLLAEYITENIINSPETVVKMSDFCALFVDFLRQQVVVVDS